MAVSQVPVEKQAHDYTALLRSDSEWQIGTIKLADGTNWEYREPAANLSVTHDILKLRVMPFTRYHDTFQVLDNSKHLFFSKEVYPTSTNQSTVYEFEMSAEGIRTRRNDIYDGFAAFHLLAAESGVAADFFASDDTIALAYSRPGGRVSGPESSGERRYVVLFKQIDTQTLPGQLHNYRIVYTPSKSCLTWVVDDKEVASEDNVPASILGFRIGLGLMTAKNIVDGHSTSIHGQGMMGSWSPIRIGYVTEARS